MSFVILALLLIGTIALVAYPLRGGAPVVAEVGQVARPAGKRPSCPGCGARYDVGDRFCVRCGHALPVVGTPSLCAACGAPHEPDDSFCAKCGAVLAGRST
jgi:predicted amidophosphoribosyltransferase